MTLTQALLPSQTLLTRALLVLAGSLLIALSAQVSVPMYPVPMTLQTLAVVLVGLTYGARLASVTVLAYLAQGAAGLPVFAGGAAGVLHLFGPTGGFLFGFVAMAFLAGWMVERGFGRGVLRLFGIALVATALLFVPGVLWLAAVTPLDLAGAFMAGCAPFLPGEAVKSAIAALVVAGGWRAVRR
jgi:biotin transport system substrate-specific component